MVVLVFLPPDNLPLTSPPHRRPHHRRSSTLNSSLFTPLTSALPLHTLTTQITRGYRGAAGEGRASSPKGIDDALRNKSLQADKEIRERHFALPPATADSDAVSVRRKRLIYRSKQRGWLEVDVLLGTWAHQNVASLDATQLDEYEVRPSQDIHTMLYLFREYLFRIYSYSFLLLPPRRPW